MSDLPPREAAEERAALAGILEERRRKADAMSELERAVRNRQRARSLPQAESLTPPGRKP